MITMNLSKKLIALTAGLAVALLFSPIHVGAEVGARYTLCRLAKEVRTLRIENTPGKCVTKYTKNGKDQIEGEAQNTSSCEDVLEKIRSHLQDAGWKCREVKDSTASVIHDSTVQ